VCILLFIRRRRVHDGLTDISSISTQIDRAGNVAETLALMLGLAFLDADKLSVYPLSTLQILWINMVTSSPPVRVCVFALNGHGRSAILTPPPLPLPLITS
jgi:magnesium-transporting ATPase (P-type)